MIKNNLNKRKWLNQLSKHTFQCCAIISSMMILFILLFIFIKGIQVFLPSYEHGAISILDFIFGNEWNTSKDLYGIGFIVINTIVSSFLALVISVFFSILSALFIVRIAPPKLANILRTTIDLLASIPSVVYGVFASGAITTFVQSIASFFQIQNSTGSSLLAVILLLAIMIYPTITSMSITAIASVDEDMIHGSYALGVSKIQTDFKLVLKSAKSGIFAGMILGLGRAFGEATAVMMVAGNRSFGINLSLFEPTRTLTTTMLSGMKETSGLDYDIRFSIGLVLMFLIIISNLILNMMKRKVGKES